MTVGGLKNIKEPRWKPSCCREADTPRVIVFGNLTYFAQLLAIMGRGLCRSRVVCPSKEAIFCLILTVTSDLLVLVLNALRCFLGLFI